MHPERLLIVALALGFAAPAFAWQHNIATWPADAFPLPIHLRPEPARHTSNEELAEIVQASFDEWNSVSCAYAELDFVGVDDLPITVDDMQVLGWEDDAEVWIYGSAAAGATQIDVLGPDGPRVDILFNDIYFDWVVGANTFITNPDREWGVDPNIEVDPASVITHEVGHLLGLGHPNPEVEGSQPDALATMVFSLLPNAQQGSLAADDKLGLCAKYPIADAHECDTDQDCGENEFCGTFSADGLGEVRLCDETRGSFGDECSRLAFICGGLCRFTRVDFSDGYCTDYCEVHADCPDDWHCEALPATTGTNILVCEPGAPPAGEDTGLTPVDTGVTPVEPGPDAGDADAADVSAEVAPEVGGPDVGPDATDPDSGEGGGSGSGCALAPSRGSGGLGVLLLALGLTRRRQG